MAIRCCHPFLCIYYRALRIKYRTFTTEIIAESMNKQLYHLAEYPHRLRKKFGHKRVIRYQKEDNGTWHDLNGEEFSERCLAAAKALAKEGVELGDRIGFYTQNSVDALAAELGCYMLRAVAVPLYATNAPEQVEFILQDADIKILFVWGQYQYNNAWEVQMRTNQLKRIVVIEQNVLLDEHDNITITYEEFVRRGDAKSYEHIASVRASQALAEDVAVIIYTSGTSGRSKGVVLNHSHFMIQIQSHYELFTFISSRDVSMSFLPHNHIFEKTWVFYCLFIGCTTAILSNPKTIQQALPMVRPTMMCNVPRFWEKVYAGVHDRISHMPKYMQRILQHAMKVGQSYRLEYVNERKRVPLGTAIMYRVYKATVFAKLKKVLGLQRGRFFPVAGASLAPEINRFLQSVSIPICYGYGLSESTATVSCFRRVGYNMDSIGELLGHLDARIDPETQEIQIKGPTIFREYYRNPEATREAFTEDGYFRTGDAGRLEGRTLFFTERIKDLFKTANGKYIAPQKLEGLLLLDPIFEQVAIIGDGHKFVSLLTYPNWDVLLAEVASRGVDVDRPREVLARDHDLRRAVHAHIEQAQVSVAGYEMIRRFTILPEPFTIENGELTPTMKVKRKVVNEHYAEAIREMYADE